MSDIAHASDGSILRVTLNCPERGNSASDDMVAELTRLIAGDFARNLHATINSSRRMRDVRG
jgi:enoyl-CoA hydratase/carnithine racemase